MVWICDEEWAKKCSTVSCMGLCIDSIVYRVEGRRPRKTWLESVKADMTELEINKEYVHDRSKWRRNVYVMKRKSNPIGNGL